MNAVLQIFLLTTMLAVALCMRVPTGDNDALELVTKLHKLRKLRPASLFLNWQTWC